MTTKVYVTAAHRKAAQSLVASGARTGKAVSPAVVKIANAKVESSSTRRAPASVPAQRGPPREAVALPTPRYAADR